MDWKEDLGYYFAKKNMFRNDYLNNKLTEYCKEYIQYINEFEGVKGNLKQNELVTFMNKSLKNEIKIEIIVDNKKELYPFTISCYFDLNANLVFDFSKYYDEKIKLYTDLGATEKNLGAYVIENEVYSENEKIEKEYIFQLLNNALKKHIEINQ